ncbi:hypothetical protein D3C86_2012970 [compost metagenome]
MRSVSCLKRCRAGAASTGWVSVQRSVLPLRAKSTPRSGCARRARSHAAGKPGRTVSVPASASGAMPNSPSTMARDITPAPSAKSRWDSRR